MSSSIEQSWNEAITAFPMAVTLHAGPDTGRPIARLSNWQSAERPVPEIAVRLDVTGNIRNQEYAGFRVAIDEGSYGEGPISHYARIQCVDPSFTALFLEFSKNLLRKLDAGVKSNRAVIDTVREWQAFFRKVGLLPLEREELTGLFGELCFVDELLSMGKDVSAVINSWQGPKGETWDFNISELGQPTLVEVKSTVRPSTNITVNSVDQLNPMPDFQTVLNFRMFDVVESPEPQTHGTISFLRTKIERKISDSGDPSALATFNERLADAGFNPEHEIIYNVFSFTSIYSRWHDVGDGFPALNRNNLSDKVRERLLRLKYTMTVADLPQIQPPV